MSGELTPSLDDATESRWSSLLAWLERPQALVALLAVLGVYRLTLVGHGAQATSDELRYYRSFLALYEGIFALDLSAFCEHVTLSAARPFAILVGLIPTSIQALLHFAVGTVHANPKSLVIGQVFNVVVTLGLTVVLFELAKALLAGERRAALFVAAVYGLMASSNVYVRHLLPFDLALTLHLGALLLIVRVPAEEALSGRTCLWAGLLLGFGHGAYPGYYLFPLALFAIVGLRRTAFAVRGRTRFANLAIGASALSVLLAYELIAAGCGRSYLLNSRSLSGTITNGAFEEGFVFLPRFLAEVEGPLGILLMLLGLVYAGRLVAARGRSARTPALVRVALVLAATFFVQASLSAVFHKMVLYGRLVHLYLPFLVIAATAALWELPWRRARTVGGALTLTLAVVGLVRFTVSLNALAYPKDVLFDLRVQSLALEPSQRFNEFEPYAGELHSPPGVPRRKPNPRLRLVNFSVMGELKGEPHRIPPDATVLFRGLHFRVHPIYAFEGLPPGNRATVEERRYQIVAYEVSSR